jgi:hypothetical protein
VYVYGRRYSHYLYDDLFESFIPAAQFELWVLIQLIRFKEKYNGHIIGKW